MTTDCFRLAAQKFLKKKELEDDSVQKRAEVFKKLRDDVALALVHCPDLRATFAGKGINLTRVIMFRNILEQCND